MSEKQKNVVDTFVENYKMKNQCDRCVNGNISALTDYIVVADNGLCPMC
jgi:hypothetical protein